MLSIFINKNINRLTNKILLEHLKLFAYNFSKFFKKNREFYLSKFKKK